MKKLNKNKTNYTAEEMMRACVCDCTCTCYSDIAAATNYRSGSAMPARIERDGVEPDSIG